MKALAGLDFYSWQEKAGEAEFGVRGTHGSLENAKSEASMIVVYVIRMGRNLSLEECRRLVQMVSASKREQIKRYVRLEDAQRTLLGDVLIRKALNDTFGLSNGAMVFGANTFGKPVLASHPEYYFNVSHSGNYVVGAVSSLPVGIDVEAIGKVDMRIADRFFAQQEKQYIIDRPSSEQERAFCQVWTKKEAYVKREGRGFAIPLNSVNVLSQIDGTCFHLIFENREAICYVCSYESMPPTIQHYTVDNLVEWM